MDLTSVARALRERSGRPRVARRPQAAPLEQNTATGAEQSATGGGRELGHSRSQAVARPLAAHTLPAAHEASAQRPEFTRGASERTRALRDRDGDGSRVQQAAKRLGRVGRMGLLRRPLQLHRYERTTRGAHERAPDLDYVSQSTPHLRASRDVSSSCHHLIRSLSLPFRSAKSRTKYSTLKNVDFQCACGAGGTASSASGVPSSPCSGVEVAVDLIVGGYIESLMKSHRDELTRRCGSGSGKSKVRRATSPAATAAGCRCRCRAS